MLTHLIGLILSAGPCTEKPCVLSFNWGPGRTAGDYATDLRYGPAADFEGAVRRALTGHGARFSDNDGVLNIILRPTVNMRSMCDETPGTGTAYNCTAVADVTVRFTDAGAGATSPPVLRIVNRCGGSTNLYMRMRQFGEYAGEMIWWTLFGKDNKERKPSAPC